MLQISSAEANAATLAKELEDARSGAKAAAEEHKGQQEAGQNQAAALAAEVAAAVAAAKKLEAQLSEERTGRASVVKDLEATAALLTAERASSGKNAVEASETKAALAEARGQVSPQTMSVPYEVFVAHYRQHHDPPRLTNCTV